MSWSLLSAAELAELDALISGRLQHTLASAYEHGWLPLDLVHHVRRTREALVPAVAAAISAHAREIEAEERAPRRWRDQLPRGCRSRSRTSAVAD